MSFEQRVIVITGASDGIGAEIARQLARERARLVLAARTRETLERVGAQCRELGGQALVVPADVTVDDDCRRLARLCLAYLSKLAAG